MNTPLTFYYGFTNPHGYFVKRHGATYFGEHAKIMRLAYDIPDSVYVINMEDGRNV